MEKEFIKIATFQGRIKEKNLNCSLERIISSLEFCDQNEVDILCMPECYLQGYFDNFQDTLSNSINLKSEKFSLFCKSLSNFKTTLILGLNEEENKKIYNTAVIIENGKLIGKYRKAYTYTPYDYIECGSDFPVFEKNGVKYGVILCFDASFIEPARILALKGAQIIFTPSYNKSKNYQAIADHLDKRTNFICRANENHVWLAISDIIWDFDGNFICPGYAAIIDNRGNFIIKGNKLKEEILIHNIPFHSLRTEANDFTFLGKKHLNKIMENTYHNYIKESCNAFNLEFKQVRYIDNKSLLEIKSLIKKAIYLPADEKMDNIITKFTNINNREFVMYTAISNRSIQGTISESMIAALVALQIKQDRIIIHYFACKEELRGKGIGTKIIEFIAKKYAKTIEAETDDDAVVFYKKNGFNITLTEDHTYNSVRYKCIKQPG